MQELEGIKAQMAAVQKKAGISEEVRKALAEKLVNALYAASGPAKVKGVLEQLQHALAEGGSCWSYVMHIFWCLSDVEALLFFTRR